MNIQGLTITCPPTCSRGVGGKTESSILAIILGKSSHTLWLYYFQQHLLITSFLKKDGNGDPVGAAFAGDLVGAISWRPDDCALAAINAKGVVNVWKFKVRTNLFSKGFK